MEPLAEIDVPERALRARRTQGLWVDPLVVATLFFQATMQAGSAFALTLAGRAVLCGLGLLVVLAALLSRRALLARVGTRRLQWGVQFQWRSMAGAGPVAILVALVVWLLWRDPAQPWWSLCAALGLAAPVALEAYTWWWSGRWPPRLALLVGYVGVLALLLAWPPPFERRIFVAGMLMFLELAVSGAFSGVQFLMLTTSIDQESDGQPV